MGRSRAAGVGRLRSSTITSGLRLPSQSSRTGLWPAGESRRSRSSSSDSGAPPSGANTVGCHAGGRPRVSSRSPYQAAVRSSIPAIVPAVILPAVTLRAELEALLDGAKSRSLGFARPDLDRERRQGAPEAVLAEGKTPDQVAEIVAAM